MKGKIKLDKLTSDNYLLEMQSALRSILTAAEHKMEKFSLILEENNPKNVLAKGYSIMQTPRGEVIGSISALEVGGEYEISLRDGRVKVKATEIYAR